MHQHGIIIIIIIIITSSSKNSTIMTHEDMYVRTDVYMLSSSILCAYISLRSLGAA